METQNNLIYFNNNRSTKIDQKVQQSMQEWSLLNEEEKTKKVTEAENSLAQLLNAKVEELMFTRGTSESIKLGIEAVFETSNIPNPHFICSTTEHPAVINCLEDLKQKGAELTYLEVDREGRVNVDDLKKLIQENTRMICVMAANNETGVIQPIEAISEFCKTNNILFFSDASQYIGKMRYDAEELPIDLLAFSAHKMYGPEGIGLLYISNKQAHLKTYLKNTYQQTLSGDLKVGFGNSAELFKQNFWDLNEHISRLKNYFEHQLLDIEGLRINGSTRHRLYNTSNLFFPEGINVDSLLKEFEFAHNFTKPSYVLKAMGLEDEEIKRCYRFSFGKDNNLEEVKSLVERIMGLVKMNSF